MIRFGVIVKRTLILTRPATKSLLNNRDKVWGEIISFTRNIYFIIKIPSPVNHASHITLDYAQYQNVTRKSLEMSCNGFCVRIVILVLTNFCGPFNPCGLYPVLITGYTPKQEIPSLQGAKGFLWSPKIPSFLSTGAEGISMFQEEPRILLLHAFPLLCCQQSLKGSIWPYYTCFS